MDRTIKRVYVSGPYVNKDRWIEECNVRTAELFGYMVAALGAYPVIPHANTRPYFSSIQTPEFWYLATLEMVSACDAVLMIGDYATSKGALLEFNEAKRLNIPVFFDTPSLGTWLSQCA
jgi:hypothetical protein